MGCRVGTKDKESDRTRVREYQQAKRLNCKCSESPESALIVEICTPQHRSLRAYSVENLVKAKFVPIIWNLVLAWGPLENIICVRAISQNDVLLILPSTAEWGIFQQNRLEADLRCTQRR